MEEGTDHEFLLAFKRLPMYSCKQCQRPTLFYRHTAPGKRICADCRGRWVSPGWKYYIKGRQPDGSSIYVPLLVTAPL